MRARKQKKEMSIGTLILLTVLFIFITFVWIFMKKDVILNNPTDFYKMVDKTGIKKDTYVELNVDAVLSNYAETKHTYYYIIPVGTDQHYIVWLDNDELISLTIKGKSKTKELDKICDKTWDFINGKADDFPKGMTIKGTISTLSPEINRHYDTVLDELITDKSLFTIHEVTIDATDTPGSAIFVALIFILLDAGLIFAIVSKFKAGKNPKSFENVKVTFDDGVNGYYDYGNGYSTTSTTTGSDNNNHDSI